MNKILNDESEIPYKGKGVSGRPKTFVDRIDIYRI